MRRQVLAFLEPISIGLFTGKLDYRTIDGFDRSIAEGVSSAEGDWRDWQDGLLAFYDKVYAAEQDPAIAQQWQSQHPQSATGSGSSGNLLQVVGISVLVFLAIVFWLVASTVIAARRGQGFFYTAFRLLGRFLLVLALLSRGMGGGSRSRGGGSGSWGGGGSSPSSGGDV
jgi:uncharacterized membrane protein YgcG